MAIEDFRVKVNNLTPTPLKDRIHENARIFIGLILSWMASHTLDRPSNDVFADVNALAEIKALLAIQEGSKDEVGLLIPSFYLENSPTPETK